MPTEADRTISELSPEERQELVESLKRTTDNFNLYAPTPTDRRPTVKLQEIRDTWRDYSASTQTTIGQLRDWGLSFDQATELVKLWKSDTLAHASAPVPEPPEPRKGLDLAASLELIDDAYIRGQYDLADATELWAQAGLDADAIEDHLGVMNLCKRSHEACTTPPAVAPSWVKQLSALAKLYMQGEITSWAALKQLDPNDNYPHVAGAILAHLSERRQSIADLAAAGRTDQTILDDGIEYCRICGRARAARELSNRGLCAACRETIQTIAQAEMKWHKGPYYRKWRKAMLKAMYRLEDEWIRENPSEQAKAETRMLIDYLPDDDNEDD